jgi:flagellar biosynthesis protein
LLRAEGQLQKRSSKQPRKHGIPIKEDKTLVEILSSLDLYQDIPAELYRAVAEILAFVYALNLKAKGGAGIKEV